MSPDEIVLRAWCRSYDDARRAVGNLLRRMFPVDSVVRHDGRLWKVCGYGGDSVVMIRDLSDRSNHRFVHVEQLLPPAPVQPPAAWCYQI